MTVDILVKDLLHYLPHREPMVWVDRIVKVGKDYKGLVGTCSIKINKKALYFLNDSNIRASSAIEFTAQSFGYLKAAYQEIHKINNPPKKTLLTGVRSCQSNFSNLSFQDGDELLINIRVLKEILPVIYVRGEIYLNNNEQVIASAEIQVYVD